MSPIWKEFRCFFSLIIYRLMLVSCDMSLR